MVIMIAMVIQETMTNKANKDNPGVIVLPPFIFLGFVAAGLAVNYLIPLPFIEGPIRIILGAVFLAYACLMAVLAFRQMSHAGTNVDVRKPTTTIISTGVYAYSRNPMYLAMALIMLSISLLVNTIWIALFIPIFIIVMNKGVIEREERYLENKFGSVYTDYKMRVRRWI